MNTISLKKYSQKNSYFWNLLKEFQMFILFSFLSCLLPIIYCLFSSLITPNGSQAVMGVGYVSPFLLAFIQISFSISIIIFAQLNKNKNSLINGGEKTFSASMWLSLFLGIAMSLFYFLSSFLYIYFSNNRPNTQATMFYGFDFIYTTTIFVFFLPIFTSFIFYFNNENKKLCLVLLFSFFGMIVLFSWLFGIIANLKIIGIGMGSTISVLILVIFCFIYVVFKKKDVFLYSLGESKKLIGSILELIFKESLTSISLSVFKGIAIVCLSFLIPLTINGFVPLSYQMSRVIWFNMMYFIPFIGIGFGEAIRFHYLSHDGENCLMDHNWKKDTIIALFALFFTLVLSIGCIFLIKPLLNLYTKNDHNPFKNGEMPEIKGWGKPTLAPSEFIEINKLTNLNLTEFPTLKPLKPLTGNPIQDAFIKIENATIVASNISEINKWKDIQIQNNPNEYQYVIDNLSSWIKWMNQANEEGVTLVQFIENKYDLNGTFKKIIDSIIAKNDIWKQEINKFEPIFKSGMSYFVYTWLYSTTDPIVTESFVNIRPLIKYEDLINKYTIDGTLNVEKLLVNNRVSDILPSLFLKIQKFNSKSMIYVSIFSIFNSVWAILLQTSARNYNKNMPYWLIVIVYILCVGGLVTFGTLFGVTFKDALGASNPFQYLDAWTFPLIIISILVILIVGLRNKKSYKKIN